MAQPHDVSERPQITPFAVTDRETVPIFSKCNNHPPTDNPRCLAAESEQALDDAARIAEEEGILYRQIDALVNKAWLQYYLLDPDERISESHPLIEAIQQARDAIPQEYLFETPGKPGIQRDRAQIVTWTHVGKLHVLEGHLSFHRLEQIPKEARKRFTTGEKIQTVHERLEELAAAYAHGLQYSALYAPNSLGIQRARDEIYEKLKLLNDVELGVVCREVRDLYSQDSVIEALLRNRVLWQEE